VDGFCYLFLSEGFFETFYCKKRLLRGVRGRVVVPKVLGEMVVVSCVCTRNTSCDLHCSVSHKLLLRKLLVTAVALSFQPCLPRPVLVNGINYLLFLI
jgi:hypothetical protein